MQRNSAALLLKSLEIAAIPQLYVVQNEAPKYDAFVQRFASRLTNGSVRDSVQQIRQSAQHSLAVHSGDTPRCAGEPVAQEQDVELKDLGI
jgi:hypothetical protein